ncbi:hypothetical protein ACU4GD_27845 [Cupriavidus basilensis]
MGLQSVEEAQDIIDLNPDGSYTVASASVDELRGMLARKCPAGAEPTNRAGWQPAYDTDR